jgi:hypothetical protein
MKFSHGFKQEPDSRDGKYPLSAVLGRSKPTVRSRYHRPGVILNQFTNPFCVGFSCQQLLQSEPIPQKGKTGTWIYREAKKIDEFGPRVEGTSVRAGLSVLKANGLIDSFFWAKNSKQVIDYLLKHGPVVAGTPWFSNMNSPNRDGVVSPTGRPEGGHAYLIIGANLHTGMLHCVNSWGIGYGIYGMFSITMKDFDKLMKNGVAAAAIEPNSKL